jgi:hypothetical protein
MHKVKALYVIGVLSICLIVSGCFKSNIDFVKNQTLFDKTVTIGGMLGGYSKISQQKWTEEKDNQGRELVIFTGAVNDEVLEKIAKEINLLRPKLEEVFLAYKVATQSQLSPSNKAILTELGKKILETESNLKTFDEFTKEKNVHLSVCFAVNTDKTGVSLVGMSLYSKENKDKQLKINQDDSKIIIESISKNTDLTTPLENIFIVLPSASGSKSLKTVNEPTSTEVTSLVVDIWKKYVSDNPEDFLSDGNFQITSTNSWKSEGDGETFFNVELSAVSSKSKYTFMVAIVERGAKWYAKFTQLPKKVY